jgi:Glycosyltransferase (GlcNAc)
MKLTPFTIRTYLTTHACATAHLCVQCHADKAAPYDPHLPSLFDGEEFSKYARLWTRCVCMRLSTRDTGGASCVCGWAVWAMTLVLACAPWIFCTGATTPTRHTEPSCTTTTTTGASLYC